MLDQPGGGQVLDLLDDPAALAADPATADVEDLDRRLELVLGEGEDVGVGGVAEHDGVLLQRPLEGADVVAQPGGPLEVQLGGRGPHLPLELADEPVGVAGHEVAEVLGQRPVLLLVTRSTQGAEHLPM